MRHRPVAKLSRSLGLALTPKAVKYLDRRPYPPGQRRGPVGRSKPYKERLIEKQRLRFQYHVSEKQLQRAFHEAARRPEPTGTALVEDLETRLDATVLRAGFARTIYQARQFVSHGHIHVDGKRVNRPAYRLKAGQAIAVAPKSRDLMIFQAIVNNPEVVNVPPYLEVSDLEATLARRPNRAEIPVICNEQLVVEYYAR